MDYVICIYISSQVNDIIKIGLIELRVIIIGLKMYGF